MLVRAGQIVLAKPLDLPEGTRVIIHIEPVAQGSAKTGEDRFSSLPFFGMWADREDLADSAEWVHKEREQWQQPATRSGRMPVPRTSRIG